MANIQFIRNWAKDNKLNLRKQTELAQDRKAALDRLNNDKAYFPLSKEEKKRLMELPITGIKSKLDKEGEEPHVINVGDMVDFVYGAAAYVSKVNGDIDPDDAFLYHYKKAVDVFKPAIKKKEPNEFQINAGAAFKLRKC